MNYKTETIKQNLVALFPKAQQKSVQIMAPAITNALLWQLAIHTHNIVTGNAAIAVGIDNSNADFKDGSEAKFDAIHRIRKNISISTKNKRNMEIRFCAADPDGNLYFYKLPPKVWQKHAKNDQLRKKWNVFREMFREQSCSFEECCE